jgi:ABC-2 type transport system ATP-binding protein
MSLAAQARTPDADPDVALAFADVTKRYGATPALAGVSLAIGKGEMFGVIGPDGAGKTTLLRLGCGLLAADSGSVRVFGTDPFRSHGAATAAIGYLSQRFSLYGDLSIDENVEFFARLHGVAGFAERRTRLLDLTGLTPFRTRLADRLSGGMKQKLALACTLVHEPPLLVLDEPTTGVDPVSRREFWKLLAEFLSQGLTIVLATPYLDEAERCGRVALLSEGRVLALDEPARLQRRITGLMLEVLASPPRRALAVARAALGAARVQLFGDRLHVRVESEEAGRALLDRLSAAGLGEVEIRPIVPSLEDVFIDLLAGAGAADSGDARA